MINDVAQIVSINIKFMTSLKTSNSRLDFDELQLHTCVTKPDNSIPYITITSSKLEEFFEQQRNLGNNEK